MSLHRSILSSCLRAVSRPAIGFFVLVALVSLAVSPLAAADTDPLGPPAKEETVFDRYPSSVGMSIASFGALGLSWKRWYGATGVEFTAGGTWDPSTSYGSIYWYSILAGLSRRLYAEDFSDWFSGGLYLVAVAGHAGEEGWEYDSSSEKYERYPYRPYLFAGAGIGIESVFFRHFSQELQFMYTGRFLNNPGIEFGVNFAFRYRY